MRLGSRCFSKGGFDQNQQFVILFVVRKACVWVGYGCLQFSYSWLSLLMWHTVKLDYCCPDYCQLQSGQPCLLYSWLSLPWSYTVKLDYSCLDHCLQLTVYRQLVLPYGCSEQGLFRTPDCNQLVMFQLSHSLFTKYLYFVNNYNVVFCFWFTFDEQRQEELGVVLLNFVSHCCSLALLHLFKQ